MAPCRMLTENHIKEGLSRAFILAVAHRAGLNCTLREFDYGIDGTFRDVKVIRNRHVESGFSLDFQAKSSERCELDETGLVYDLEAKSHRDLVDENVGCPRILIVMALHDDPQRWLEIDAESMILRRSAWWVSLRGQPPTTNKQTERIRIPATQLFNVSALSSMMERIRTGELP